ncbi:FAD-dependent oxidoreductase, partial [Klebsiella pneumoniae]|nr:FAD-dependent oxidoreductase [Klebsiella pneumoniae]
DLRRFALEGMQLYGRLKDAGSDTLHFADDLAANLDNADKIYNGICGLIDKHIAETTIDAPPQAHYAPVWEPAAVPTELDLSAACIGSIIWTTGFRSDWSWIDLPMFD